MIITLKGANFSSNNIGTLSTFTIFTSLGTGATYDGVKTVDKGASFTGTVTIADGYEIGSAGVTVTMGTETLSDAATIDGSTITINIASVTANVTIKVPTLNTSTGEEGGEDEPETPIVPDENTIFDFDFITNNLDDYALSDIFTIPDGSDTSKISYDSSKGMNLNNSLPYGLSLVNPIDASKAWTLEFTVTLPTPTVLAGNRKSFIAGDDLYPFVFINGSTYDDMGFQISNGSHATKYGILVYDEESSYKIVYDGNTTVEIFVNNTSQGTVSVNFAGQQFTVLLGNVKGKSSAYVWQNVEETPSYLKNIKFYYN